MKKPFKDKLKENIIANKKPLYNPLKNYGYDPYNPK